MAVRLCALFLSVLALGICTIAVSLAADEIPVVAVSAPVVPQEPISQSAVSQEPEVQWLWGEVISVDPEKSAILVKYLDYEIDKENEILFTADGQTTYENVAAVSDIKPNQAVSVDYVITVDGKNAAKHISLEQQEETTVSLGEDVNQGDIEMAPEDLQQPEPTSMSQEEANQQ